MSSAPHSPPFRAEHIGSLLRPDELVKKRYAVADKSATPDELVPVEQKAIKEVVKLEQECGIHSITNGEYSRHQFWGTFFETLEGMEEVNMREGGYDQSIFRAYAPDVKSFMHAKTIPNSVTVATGKIKHTGKSSFLPEFEYLKTLLPESEWKNIKLTLTSPSWYHFRYGPKKAYVNGVYESDEEYFKDVAAAYQTELKILYDAGLRNGQVDDPNLACKFVNARIHSSNSLTVPDFCSEAMLDGWKNDKENFQTADEQLQAYIKFYNDCLKRPDDFHMGIHLCRGNYIDGKHFSEGAYDRIAAKLFNDLNVSTYYLEYDTPRAGGFEPLKHLPKNKNVVLGVVTSKFPKLEDQKEMVERVYKAADYVAEGSGQSREEALQRLCVSPQCGFASHAEGNPLGYEDMKKKLQLVRSIADEVWPGQL
ncbi:hypothetical protein LTR91_019839 [Friedmanniomyces endolithicus]|uniref:Cobalamin-independent methionine synthase MetE C-terminal/archaeal domain-containing protein n=1 Tax=Friedmanniomyces endolithicus TaxID=329885 RepID=A0AAN6H9R6_9PEZI|nr:hypothetical protein LTR75_003014 [Friedmanniomyces endolithicus]KAK0838228.1 hypothetical protein LTR03_012187 [Friedmanniomyces endolithicus]KAK0871281.1 hypothetical protein LTS02_001925 [Friedmanniomyces endolithicus]KAK0875354.1 hypothetical protein LTR87_010844 [Friedmanniomyces endolithicus]KAK0922744.1 hypothetical protein LTR57_007515 [Friedmanniomyces endolithicus]